MKKNCIKSRIFKTELLFLLNKENFLIESNQIKSSILSINVSSTKSLLT